MNKKEAGNRPLKNERPKALLQENCIDWFTDNNSNNNNNSGNNNNNSGNNNNNNNIAPTTTTSQQQQHRNNSDSNISSQSLSVLVEATKWSSIVVALLCL